MKRDVLGQAAMVAAVWGAVVVVHGGCGSSQPVAPASSSNSGSQVSAPRRELPLLGRIPEFSLTDPTGRTVTEEHLAGRSAALSFLTAADQAGRIAQAQPLGELQKELKARGLAKSVRIVSIAADSQMPSAADQQALAKAIGTDGDAWLLLTGSTESVRELRELAFPQALAAPAAASAGEQAIGAESVILIDPQGDLRGLVALKTPEDRGQLLTDLAATLEERVVILDNALVSGDAASEVLSPPWLEERRQAQIAAVARTELFHDFAFEDRRKESGITFRHRVVDDAGRWLVAAHYDHGNGVVIADVDRDGLEDIFFVNQVGKSELWRNLGHGKFEDISQSSGVVLPADRIGVSASFADIDNDGDADLYVTTVRRGNVLFENLGNGKFRDISQDSGLAYEGHSSSAEFFDYDRDGLLDLFLVNVGIYTTDKVKTVTNDRTTGPDKGQYTYHVANADAFAAHLKPERTERSVLYHNLGRGKFEDVTEAMQLVDPSWTGDASPVDVNDDGWIDLYLVCMQGHDVYYENVEGKHFKNRSRSIFPATPWGTMGIKVFDYDNDGQFDIFLSDMHTDMKKLLAPAEEKQKIPSELFDRDLLATDGNHVWGNALFHKEGPGKFSEVSDAMGTESFWPWGLSAGDLNADGFEDVFVSASMNFPFRYAVNSVLLNDRGRKFVDSEFALGVEPRRAGRTAIPWFELDFAGEGASHPVQQVFRGKGLAASRAVVWGAIGTRSSVIFDVDNDGDLDIVTSDFNSSPMVLISSLSERKKDLKFLKVRLQGSKSNRDGLGAVVRVTAGDRVQTKVYDGQSGYLSQSSYPLYFGLAGQEKIASVEVIWPSGGKQTISAPKMNSTIDVQEE